MDLPPPCVVTMPDASSLFFSEISEHREALEAVVSTVGPPFLKALSLMREGVQNGGKLIFFGNGGSAADAQHIAAEMIVRYHTDRPPIAALSLTTDTSILTACANDLGFDALFERQIAGLGRNVDVAIGISTSGKSSNVLAGLRQAKRMGLRTIALTGSGGAHLADSCDAAIVVPSATTARIQEMHILIGHVLCKSLEATLHLV